jgi:transglutaminase TgpA-like protein
MSVVRVGWSVAVLAVAATQLARAWAGVTAAAVFVAAILVTYGCVLLARRLRVPAGFTVLTVLTLAAAGAYFATGTVTSPTDPGQSLSLLDTLTGTVPRLLTAPRPAPAVPMLLTPGVLLVVIVSLVAALAVRGRSLLAPAVGAAVLYTAAALLTAGQADRYGLVALALLVMIGLGWLVIDGSRKGTHLLPPVALLTLLAGVAAVATVFPAANGFEPRKLVKPPVTDLTVASPLPRLAAWAAADGADLFRVQGPEVPLRLVALSDYTGATWRAASLYGPVGAVPPPDLPDGTVTATTELSVTVDGLAGTWLPTACRATSTNAESAVVDPDSGSLVLPTGVTPGMRYTVKSTVDKPADDVLRTATVPSGPATRRYLTLPELPYALAEYARRTVANARSAFEQAVAIEEVVRNGRRAVADARLSGRRTHGWRRSCSVPADRRAPTWGRPSSSRPRSPCWPARSGCRRGSWSGSGRSPPVRTAP